MAGGSGRPTRSQPRSLHERALGLLSVRARSRVELRRRLIAAGFESEAVDEELEALSRVGLVDDEAFARAAVEEGVGRRLRGSRAIQASLASRGVDRATIERAVADAGGDEDVRALALARSRARRLAGLPRDVAARRLADHLARRGYHPTVARRAAAAALAVDPVAEDA